MCSPRGKGTPLHPILQGITFLNMATTSINIQPCKIGSSEQHNERTKPLDYVRSELTHLNESWHSDDKTLHQHLAEIERAYLAHKGKKMHAKATPIREGVIVIQRSTTMEDLHRFAKECQERWGIVPLQVHIHRDEGYMHAKEWTSNLHAHIVWRWTDEQGITRKLGRHDMVAMQTLLAECLGMERGVSSDKKHLSSLQFKVEAEERRLEETQSKLNSFEEKYGDVENVREKIKTAVEAKISPIEAILERNTTSGWLGSEKTDYGAVIREIREQEEKRAIVKVAEGLGKDQEIRSLKQEVEQLRKALAHSEDTIRSKDNDLFLLAHMLRGDLGKKFEEFKDEAQAYFSKTFGRVLELARIVLMWAGKAIRDNLGNIYSADLKEGRMLINGNTIEQHESLERKSKAMKEQEEQHAHSRGIQR